MRSDLLHDRDHQRDQDLVRDALAGEVGARERFVERMACVPRILAASNARLGSPLDPETLLDVVQEVQLAVWRRLDSYRGEAALETWVYRFCHFRLLKALENARLENERRQDLLEELGPQLVPLEPEGCCPDCERPRSGLPGLLRHLSGREAQVTRMRHLEQLEMPEIGRALGISVSSVKTHYYRAIEKLRQVLRIEEEAHAR